jgi:hypothetical protein
VTGGWAIVAGRLATPVARSGVPAPLADGGRRFARSVIAHVWYPASMQPEPELPVLRREVERPATGGHGLMPLLVLAAAMTSTLAAAALAMSIGPRARHCPRSGQSGATVTSPAPTFARPAAPAARAPVAPPPRAGEPAPALAPAAEPTCAPRVYRGQGDVQEWTYETCASAPMPRRFVLTTR